MIDMNLGPEWIACLSGAGHEAIHWSTIGRRDESDEAIMRWAQENGHVVLTADLDFGNRLVRLAERFPSVVQIRTDDTLVRIIGTSVVDAVNRTQADLAAGALVTVESKKFRVRRLSAPESF